MLIVQRLMPGVSWIVAVGENGKEAEGGLVTSVNIGGNYFAFRVYMDGKPTKKIRAFCEPNKFKEAERLS